MSAWVSIVEQSQFRSAQDKLVVRDYIRYSTMIPLFLFNPLTESYILLAGGKFKGAKRSGEVDTNHGESEGVFLASQYAYAVVYPDASST